MAFGKLGDLGRGFGRLGSGLGGSSGGGVSTVIITYRDHAEDATALSTYNFSSKAFAIGAADASRLVGVAVTGRVAANTTAVASSVIIGGVAGTLIDDGRNTATSNLLTTSLWQAEVPTGTTATVSVVFDTTMARAAVSVFSIINSDKAVPITGAKANFTGTSTGAVATGSITIPTNGAAIVAGALAGGAGASVAPTNYTADLGATAVGTSWHTAGHDNTSGSRSYTMTWTATGPTTPSAVFAAWAPAGGAPSTPSLDFSDPNNSQYIPII